MERVTEDWMIGYTQTYTHKIRIDINKYISFNSTLWDDNDNIKHGTVVPLKSTYYMCNERTRTNEYEHEQTNEGYICSTKITINYRFD